MKVRLPVYLAIWLSGGKSIQGNPPTLLQADYFNAGLSQAPGKGGPGSPGPDYQNIGNIVPLSHYSAPYYLNHLEVWVKSLFSSLRRES
jgi:hypothetical protein